MTYRVTGPALISFSGGRTSAYLLRAILDAHDGTLPPDVHVVFANTGRERPETLRFVQECASRWGVAVRWVEWRPRERGAKVTDRFEEVGPNSASRNGEPFAGLIGKKQYLPNVAMRYCTIELKIRVMRDFMLAEGYDHWDNIIGLRADEMRRIASADARNESGKERFKTRWPLLHAGVTARDVWRFWLGRNADPKALVHPLPQGFDLGLYPYEGNCDLCFLKGREKRAAIIRENPGVEDWWIEQESTAKASRPGGARWIKDEPYSEMAAATHASPLLPGFDRMSSEADAECGVSGTDHRIRCGSRAR